MQPSRALCRLVAVTLALDFAPPIASKLAKGMLRPALPAAPGVEQQQTREGGDRKEKLNGRIAGCVTVLNDQQGFAAQYSSILQAFGDAELRGKAFCHTPRRGFGGHKNKHGHADTASRADVLMGFDTPPAGRTCAHCHDQVRLIDARNRMGKRRWTAALAGKARDRFVQGAQKLGFSLYDPDDSLGSSSEPSKLGGGSASVGAAAGVPHRTQSRSCRYPRNRTNVALHLRRGDVLKMHNQKHPAASAKDFARVLQKSIRKDLRNRTSFFRSFPAKSRSIGIDADAVAITVGSSPGHPELRGAPLFHVFSEGPAKDFEALTKNALDIVLRNDEDDLLSFYCLAVADVLVTSISSFSRIAGRLSTGPVYWMQPNGKTFRKGRGWPLPV